MREGRGDLWQVEGLDAICITTNGFVKRNGAAVMGRGIAKQAALKFPGLEFVLGNRLRTIGNHVCVLRENPTLVAFPVKPARGVEVPPEALVSWNRRRLAGQKVVPGWALRSVPELIERSARELVALTEERGWRRVGLNRPGCGAGELEWSQIRPLLEAILDDRFISYTF